MQNLAGTKEKIKQCKSTFPDWPFLGIHLKQKGFNSKIFELQENSNEKRIGPD